MAAPVVLNLFHFNIQYCAGGVEELWADQGFDASDEALQDATVTESFLPVLEVLEAHPDWTFTLEMQGLMVDVMAERHPEVLARLQALAAAGQVELVSFHWSDTLFTAFGVRDAEKSAELTRRSFEAQGLELSEVVFTQEGQFSQGMLDRMPEWGYRIAVLPHNLGEYLWGSIDAEIYSYGEVLVLPSRSNAYVDWAFLDDGELWATGDLNCYLGPAFVYDAEATAERVSQLEAMEAEGARIAGISAYVDSLEVEPVALPPVLDGTWQPDETGDLFRWMGGAGELWAETEQDNAVRVANHRARASLLAAESVPGADADLIEAAWKYLLLSEVSDSTGWNPFESEVAYSLYYAGLAETAAEEAVAPVCDGASQLFVQGAGGEAPTVTPDGAPSETSAEQPARPDWLEPLSSGRDAELVWRADADGWRLDVEVAEGEGPFTLSFPWDAQSYVTVPALGDALVEVDAADIYADDIGLPLSWGLSHLREGWSLVLHHDSVFLAANYSRARQVVELVDEVAPSSAFTWTFHLVGEGMADPVELARRLNVEPDVVLPCDALDEPYTSIPSDCACGSASPGPGLAGLAAFAWLRRRRRRAPAGGRR